MSTTFHGGMLTVVWTVLLASVGMNHAWGTETVVIDFDQADPSQYLDRWMYPFNVSPGSRIQAPLFGAVGSPTFDDRDGQMLLAANTAAFGIPSGLATGRYHVESLSLTVTETTGDYPFDPSYDAFTTYLSADNAQYEPDVDAGRSIELFGTQFRGGFTKFGWPDGVTSTDAPVFSAGSSFGPMDRGTRDVFAADAHGTNVSNNIDSANDGRNAFDPEYFAIGQAFQGTEPLSAGDLVPAGARWVFNIDIADASIAQYVQSSLASGQLGLIVSSLHATEQFGGVPIPNLATANHFAYAAPVLTIEYRLLDETPGDLDLDRDSDSADLLLFLGFWTGSDYTGPPRTSQEGDMDADGDVDSADLLDLIGAWTGAQAIGVTASHDIAASAPDSLIVPETISPLALVLGLSGLALRTRHRLRRADTSRCVKQT